MTIELAKDSIDLGMVTSNEEAMVTFYRDVLGFTEEPPTPFPEGGTMRRLRCGTSLIKIVAPDKAPGETSPPAPIPRATGLRYWTIIVSNLDEIIQTTEAAGYETLVPSTEIRPGVTLAIVADPDGNSVEFVHIQA